MSWVRRLHRLSTALIALAVAVVAIAAPDLTWSAAPDMGTSAYDSAPPVDDDEDAPSNGESEAEEEREVVDAVAPVTLPIRHAEAQVQHHQLLGAAPAEFVRRATPPPES